MRPHRLERLAQLTRGAALISLGALAACQDAVEPPHINAPYQPPNEASVAPSADAAVSTATAAPTFTDAPKHVNAPSNAN